MTKASAWTDGGTSFTNAGTVSGGKRTDAGATQTINSFAIVDTVSGAVQPDRAHRHARLAHRRLTRWKR